MRNFGKLDDLGLGMGLRMYPDQIVASRYASLDGLGGESNNYFKFLIIGLLLLFLFRKGLH